MTPTSGISSSYSALGGGAQAALAASRQANAGRRAAENDNDGGQNSLQPSLIWARPLRVLSNQGTGFQGDLIAANGGFVSGVAEVDTRGRVVSVSSSTYLVDPSVRARARAAEDRAAEEQERARALAQGANPVEAERQAKVAMSTGEAAPAPAPQSVNVQASTALRTQTAYQSTAYQALVAGGGSGGAGGGGTGGAGASRVNVTA